MNGPTFASTRGVCPHCEARGLLTERQYRAHRVTETAQPAQIDAEPGQGRENGAGAGKETGAAATTSMEGM